MSRRPWCRLRGQRPDHPRFTAGGRLGAGNFARGQGIDLIYLLAPTSTEERIRIVAERSRGFIYLVSVTGVTGARDSLPADLEAFVARVRRIATQPLCIGFGISTPQQAKGISRIADGVIIDSRLIQLMETDESLAGVENLIRDLGRAIDQPDGAQILPPA